MAASQTSQAAAPRRILIAVGSYPPGYGGASLRAHRTYQRLSRYLPIDLHAATISGRGDMGFCTEYDGVPIFQTGQETSVLQQFRDLRPLFLARGAKRFDLVHALGQSGVATAAAAWAMLLGIPVVRELTVNRPIRRSFHPIALLRRATFLRAKLVVALNTGLRQRLLEAGVDPQRIWERPNPVDTTMFFRPDTVARHQARLHYRLEGNGPVHLLLGRMSARKNQLFALDVLARLPDDHRLLLLGPALHGDELYVRKIKERIADLGIAERVIFWPHYVEDVGKAYHAADCCWIPSTSEGMPNVLLEALVCGLPVVVNGALTLDEHIAEGVNGFTCALDADDFARNAARAVKILANEAAAARIARTAAQRYGAESIDQEFARRLSAILGVTPKTPLPCGERAMPGGE